MTPESPDDREARRRAKSDANVDRYIAWMARKAERDAALSTAGHYFARLAIGAVAAVFLLWVVSYGLQALPIVLTRPQHGSNPLTTGNLIWSPRFWGHSVVAVVVGWGIVLAGFTLAWSSYTEWVGERVLNRRATTAAASSATGGRAGSVSAGNGSAGMGGRATGSSGGSSGAASGVQR